MTPSGSPTVPPLLIRLERVTRDNWREAIALDVAPEQTAFVPSVAVSLAKETIRPDGPDEKYLSFAVMLDEIMVGFGQLVGSFGRGDTTWIGGFLVDARYQGRGVGAAALNALVEVATTETGCRIVGLTVVPDNDRARRLYERRGFRTEGDLYEGEVVYRLELADREAVR